MFMNFKRLLLTLYRLEEGQQDILQRLDKLERRGNPPGGEAATPLYKGGGRALLEGERKKGPLEKGAGRPEGGLGDSKPDTWLIDGIEAILSYRRNPKEEAK